VRTVAVSSRQAGSGKSILACQIAAAAQALEYAPAVLIDMSRNEAATRWGETRRGQPPVCVHSNADRLPELIDQLTHSGTALAVIDTAPFHLVSNRAACAMADLVLIPVTATATGIDAARKTAAVAQRVGTPVLQVINGVATLPGREMVRSLRQIAPLAPSLIRRHALFAECMARGETVFERDPFGDITRDVHELWNAMAFHLEASDPEPATIAAE
jgi:cellulose biosynthesis protein BcsQ